MTSLQFSFENSHVHCCHIQVILSPIDSVADTYRALLPEGTLMEFQRILELKVTIKLLSCLLNCTHPFVYSCSMVICPGSSSSFGICPKYLSAFSTIIGVQLFGRVCDTLSGLICDDLYRVLKKLINRAYWMTSSNMDLGLHNLLFHLQLPLLSNRPQEPLQLL